MKVGNDMWRSLAKTIVIGIWLHIPKYYEERWKDRKMKALFTVSVTFHGWSRLPYHEGKWLSTPTSSFKEDSILIRMNQWIHMMMVAAAIKLTIPQNRRQRTSDITNLGAREALPSAETGLPRQIRQEFFYAIPAHTQAGSFDRRRVSVNCIPLHVRMNEVKPNEKQTG